MKEYKVLYQIRSLEKLISRTFIKEMDLENENNDFFPTPTQMQILEYILKHHNDKIYQKDLEEVLGLRRATVSGVLQTMEKNGLLDRITNESDARSKQIILNKKAVDIFNKAENKMSEIEKIILSDISSDEIEIFSSVLKKMKENMKKSCLDSKGDK